MEINGGSAIPVVVVTDAEVQGGLAYPVYGYAAKPTDRAVIGGKARRVRVITASDLKENGGIYTLVGTQYAMPVYADPSGQSDGGIAEAVYPMNAWPGPWYLTTGLTAAGAAYQAKGAANSAASLVNLANPGTNDILGPLAGSTDPTWDVVNGWVFDGLTQNLITAVAPVIGCTVICRFAGSPTFNRAIFGTKNQAPPAITGSGFWIMPRWTIVGTGCAWELHGKGGGGFSPLMTSGVVGAADLTAYRNGVFDHTEPSPGQPATLNPFAIGGKNNGDGTADNCACSIQAWVYYPITLSDAQMLDVMTKMAML